MNEAAKAHIKSKLESLGPGAVIDFDFGTQMGRRAAEAAIIAYLFDDPESVTPRPISASTGT